MKPPNEDNDSEGGSGTIIQYPSDSRRAEEDARGFFFSRRTTSAFPLQSLLVFVEDVVSGLIPSWRTLNALSRSKAVRTSYFWLLAVPLAAKLLEATGPDLHLPMFNGPLTLRLSLPFSWRMFYFGSVAFACASGLCVLWCPKIVRDFRTYQEFLAEGRRESQVRDYLHGMLDRGAKPLARHKRATGIPAYFLKTYCEGSVPQQGVLRSRSPEFDLLLRTPVAPAMEPDAFWYVLELATRTNRHARQFIGGLYVIGFGFLGIVLWQNFTYVWKSLWP